MLMEFEVWSGRDSSRDLARNEEFSEIAVIHIYFTVLKTKTQLSIGGGGGGSCGENFEISHAIDM